MFFAAFMSSRKALFTDSESGNADLNASGVALCMSALHRVRQIVFFTHRSLADTP